MKNDRQSMILEIISQENIETQEQLLVRLQERGITSTQATISRDIKQMHLIKEPVGHGVYKYAVSGNRTRLNFAEKLRTIFRESITSIDSAQNIVSSRPCRAWPAPPAPRWTTWASPTWWGPWRETTRPFW